MQVDGLKTGGTAGAAAESAAAGNLAEQAVGAALRYRAYAPVLDKLLQEVGLSEQGMTGLLAASHPGVPVESNAGKPDGQSPPATNPTLTSARATEPASKAR
jgi:Flotillin